jgi:hypothetical protein
MTDPKPPELKISEVTFPLCNHCGTELPALSQYSWASDAGVILCAYCPHCRKVLTWMILPAFPQESARIRRPD